MTKLTDTDSEYKSLMKKVNRCIEKADLTGYEFSDLESGIISRIARAGSMDGVPVSVEKAYKIIHQKVMKRRVRYA